MSTSTPSDPDIRRVYLIFKTHLDLGFTDFAAAVAGRYFEEFIPNAIRLARQLRIEGSPDRFIWTTGSWLVFEYLEQASRAARRAAEEAIVAGDLVWHAIPFTFHSELAGAETFRYGLGLSRRLDERFGRKTIAAKMTDVPGHTRAIVPLLAEAGVKFLHIGRNHASCPPDVPENFVWRHTDGSEIVVVYHHDYGYASAAPGMRSAIAFAHGRDNHPPQDAEAVRMAFRGIRKKYPGSDIRAATLDEYAEEIWAARTTLPVVTGELGDTWIHGIASHPERVAAYKAMTRLRERWTADGRFDPVNRKGHDRFNRLIMCVPEHTWGIRVDDLEDLTSYQGAAFERLRRSKPAKRVEASWDEQLDYVRRAVEGLNVGLRSEAEAELSALKMRRPRLSGWKEWNRDEPIDIGPFSIGFDAATGSIDRLVDRSSGRHWASPSHQLGSFLFESFSAADVDRFKRQYLRNPKTTAWWSARDFGKPGMDPEGKIRHQTWSPILDGIRVRPGTDATELLAVSHLASDAVDPFGAPPEIHLHVSVPHRSGDLQFELRWYGKTACRLPAACWLGFNAAVDRPRDWILRKMNQPISPYEVVRRGNRRMHAIEKAIHEDNRGTITIEPLDAPLCSMGSPALLNFHQRQPGLSGGLWFCLWNNVWNTNFPYWHGGDCRFRFAVRLDSSR